jgi:hypothetical protein
MAYKASEEGQSLIRGGRYSEFALGSVKAALEALAADPIMPDFRHKPTFNERLMPIVAGLADCPDPAMRDLLLGDLDELVGESR